MTDRSNAGTVGGEGKISSRKLKQLTETAMAQYAAAVLLERNPATFGDAVIDISNNLNAQSANALASAWGMGRGRHLPAPSPALSTN